MGFGWQTRNRPPKALFARGNREGVSPQMFSLITSRRDIANRRGQSKNFEKSNFRKRRKLMKMMSFEQLTRNDSIKNQQEKHWLCIKCLPKNPKSFGGTIFVLELIIDHNVGIECCRCRQHIKEGFSIEAIAKIFHRRLDNFKKSYKACEDGELSLREIISRAASWGGG